ncbi:unnamed protein product [marine sediment metagenome]|uniref:Uncharacterized protein n=1 Tax=marine sediment metagenome TaxID=412755 RepID=X1ULF4_9ZZZZ
MDKKLYELVHLARKALKSCHYSRAEKLIKQFHLEALKSKDAEIIELATYALIECRRFHFLSVLHELERIDPIQSLRKELS